MAIIAYILDLDGVVTHTAKLHMAAWKQLFDEYNEYRIRHGMAGFEAFDPQRDYLLFVDGKPRLNGTSDFLKSRGISLPLDKLRMLGKRKNEIFSKELENSGPKVFPDAIEALHAWRRLGIKTAVASSSKSCASILRMAGIEDLFDARVDGTYLEKWKIPGKPAPAMFLAAAKLLNVAPAQAAVLEDAISGVQAARAGRFGLVVGVARFGQADLLKAAGADVIVTKLTELLLACKCS